MAVDGAPGVSNFLTHKVAGVQYIELICRHLVSRLFAYPMDVAQRNFPNHPDLLAVESQEILEEVSFDIVEKCFKKCFDFLTDELNAIDRE